jgi:hypothetical protein
MPDFSTLQQLDQGQYAPPAAVAANPPSSPPAADVPPVSSWLAPGLPQPSDDAITVVGPATAARYRSTPPAPPAATLKGDDAQRAVDDYATYLNWRRENVAAPGSKAAQTPLALVTAGTAPNGGVSPGAGGPAAVSPPAGKFGLAPSKADDDALAKVMALDAVTASPPAAPSGAAGAGPNAAATGGAASSSAAPAAASDAGMVGNLAAGVNKGIASTLGAPVDLVTGALNLVPRGINAVAGTNLPTLPPGVGGSQWLMSAMGLLGADPRTIQPQGPAEQLAQGVGGGIGAALTPLGVAGQVARAGEAIGPVAGGVARTLAEAPVAPTAMSGAGAGAGGVVAGDVARHEGVPEQYIPLIETAGQMAGGIVPVAGTAATMLAARGVRAAYNAATSTLPVGELAPMVDSNGQPFVGTDGKPIMVRQNMMDNAASTAARRAGMSPDDLAASLFSGPPNVPGAQPTAGQLTGNRGLLGMERNLTTASEYAREAFSNRRVSQNNAQVAHLANLSAEDAQASAAGNYFVNRLDQIDQQEAAAVARLQAAYNDAVSRVGGVAHPGDIGADMQGHIAGRRAPAVRAADEAVNQAEGNVRYMARAIGGEQGGTDAQTVIQGYGQRLRDGLAAVEDEANQERRALYAARDPDGKLAISAAPIAAAAQRLEGELRPAVNQKFGSRNY